MTKSRMVKLTYRRFNNTKVSEREVEPYGLKQSGRRWYIIAKNKDHGDLTVYSLDRIESLCLTNTSFEFDKTLDVASYFDEVIGVNVDSDYDCEKVVLRVYGKQSQYIETLPLHKSQRLITHTKEYSDYELNLRLEYEFQHAILALGPNAEIISPQWLREEIKWLAEETAKRYTDGGGQPLYGNMSEK